MRNAQLMTIHAINAFLHLRGGRVGHLSCSTFTLEGYAEAECIKEETILIHPEPKEVLYVPILYCY